MDIQVRLVLILIDIQYSKKAVFSFEKGWNHQNHSSGSHHSVTKSPPHPQQNFQSPLHGGWGYIPHPLKYADCSSLQTFPWQTITITVGTLINFDIFLMSIKTTLANDKITLIYITTACYLSWRKHSPVYWWKWWDSIIVTVNGWKDCIVLW